MSSRFFQNTACEFFPCHNGVAEKDFNCLFCYCPLYVLGKNCGGNFEYTEEGIKSCENCSFPHYSENYDQVIARFPEIAAVVQRTDKEKKQGPNIAVCSED